MRSDNDFRILIVDDQREVVNVLSDGLASLERGHDLVDVPSGEEAILEAGPFDLVVAAYRLPGMSGLDVIERALQDNPNLKSVLVTGQDTDDLPPDVDRLGIWGVFERPLAVDAFTQAVEEALQASNGVGPSNGAGSLHELDVDAVSQVLAGMYADLGAHAVALVDREGGIVQQHGSLDGDLRFGELAVLLASNLATTGEISAYLGDGPPAALHYYDGGHTDIYSLVVNLDYFVAIVFPAGNERQMGPVVRYGARGVSDLLSIVSSGWVADTPPASDAVVEDEGVATDVEVEPDEVPEGEGEDEVEETAPESIDLDALDAARDTADSEAAEAFWESEISDDANAADGGAESISLDEAMDLGLIPRELD